jgi:transcriptional regulator with XRE-family HTH domain
MAKRPDFPARLRQLRTSRELSLRKLAEQAGCTHPYLVDLEHGRSEPTLGLLRRLAQALGVTVGELVDCSASFKNLKV